MFRTLRDVLIKPKTWGLRRRTTGFRLYQQLAVLVIAIVTIPLGGLSIWLYDINDSALRKQISESVRDVMKSTVQGTQQELMLRQQQSETLAGVYTQLSRGMSTPWYSKARFQQLLGLDASLQVVGLCHPTSGRLYQWAGASPVPTNVAIEPWLCQADISTQQADKTSHHLRRSWQPRSSLAPQWLVTKTHISPQYTLVQVRKLQSLEALFQNLLHLQKAGVWLIGPNQQSLHLRQRGNRETLDFESNTPPPEILKALEEEQHRLNAKEAQETEKPINPMAPLKALMTFNLTARNDDAYTLTPLAPSDWWLVVSPDRHENFNFIKQARLKTFFLIGVSLLISLLIGTGYIFGIIRNFRQLIKGIKAMGEGHYGRQIRLITNWVTPFEIRYLTAEVNRMGRQLDKQVTTIQEANHELAKLDELKSNLIDTVSHELRTPLMNIQGYTNRLITHHGKLSEELQLQALNTIRKQCKRLNRLIEDLLVIPDLENHTLRVFNEPLSLEHLWNRLQPLLSDGVQEALHTSLLPKQRMEDLLIDVDEDRLQQVLINLFENASKYSRTEGDPIYFQIHEIARINQPSVIQLTVENTSEPVTDKDIERLFEKFHRLDDGLTRKTRGSGLGLFIALALTHAMGGELRLGYAEGLFTATVEFPAAHHPFTH
jgi:signal transduction histidine kinase